MARSSNVRIVLGLQLIGVAAVAAVLLLGLGLPLLARHALTPRTYGLIVASCAVTIVLVGVALLYRSIARPIDRLLSAAEALGSTGGEMPILGEEAVGRSLSQAAVAFERLAGALGEERVRLGAKVAELTAANRELAEARESLLRSEKLATVGRLASGVAHEVGNPLGAISGYVDLARSRLSEGKPVDEYLARIGTEAARIDRIVRELLDFARPTKLTLSAIELAPTVDAALRLAGMQQRFREVEVELAIPEGLPRVEAEEHALAQVLLNVFLNAGDAMGGKGKVQIAAAAEPGGVTLTIADSGPGIRAEDLPRIFDPFFTTKEPGQGTGLGLAICHRIMESFGGEIGAGKGAAGGAVFTLRLHSN